MTLKHLQNYEMSDYTEKQKLLKKQTEKYLNDISTMETFAESTEKAEVKALTCQLLIRAFAGKLKKERYSDAEKLALSFAASIGYNELLDYNTQANFFSPRLATCLYFLDCLQDPECVTYLKQFELIPADFDISDHSIRRTISLLGLAVIFNTMDRPFRYLEAMIGFTTGVAFWGAVALTITAVIAGMGALAISFPFFAIPAAVCAAMFIAGAFLYTKIANKHDNDIQHYKDAIKSEWEWKSDEFNGWTWGAFFKNNPDKSENAAGPSSDIGQSNQFFNTIKQIVTQTQESEQYKHLELKA